MKSLADRVAEAIRDTSRCNRFYDEHKPCDGLQGCWDCLLKAAAGVLGEVLEVNP